ncbi:MAG: hypothetical protein AB2404_06605 [Planifilum fimeticola]
MKREWLYSILGMFAGMAIFMAVKGEVRWSYIIGATTGMLLYFFARHLLRKKDGTPETDERIRQNVQRAALYTLLVLTGVGVLVLGLTTSPGQQIPVEYIAVYCLFSLFTLAAVLAIVKRR